MRERSLLKAGLIVSIVGLIALALLSRILEPALKPISQLAEEEGALIRGRVVWTKDYGNMSVVRLVQYSEIDVLLYKPSWLELEKDALIEVRGRTRKGRDGQLEFVADEVRKLSA